MTAASAAGGFAGSDVSQLTLGVDGRRYGGWVSADIERSLDMFSHSFSLSYIDRWAENKEPWPIREGAQVQIFYARELLVTGWVNTAQWEASAEDWTLSANGRSLSGDLEDCSVFHASGLWKNVSPIAIINQLIADYDMTATSTAASALLPLKRFLLQEGESVKDAIERLCEQIQCLAVSRPDGNLELLRADIPRDKVVVVPVHMGIRRRVETNDQNRFSDYYTVAQSRGNRNRAGEAIVKAKYTIQDEGVERHRPIVLLAEHGEAQLDSLKARSAWERNVRAGRAMRYTLVLPGVLAPNNRVWTPGWHCIVKDDQLGVDDTLVLVRANLRASASELATELEFTLPAAYSTLTYPPKKLNPKPKVAPPTDENICEPLSKEEAALLARFRAGQAQG